jgi:ABC-2 type transport system ATP-binding protein
MTGNPQIDAPATTAFRFDGLTKHYGELTAVDAVDLAIPAGSFFGLVGPNGAGKTTLISMAVGLIRPDRGTSQVHGRDLWRDPIVTKSALGILLEGEMLPRRLTGSELLNYVGLLRGLAADTVTERTDEVLAALDLTRAADVVVADYSTGMRKKIALAVALLHGPSILVLDEPFEAVDPVSAATIRSILNSFVATGGTVLFSSHVMPLVEMLCDHVAVLDAGRVVAQGPIDEVRRGRSLDEAFSELVGSAERTPGALSWFAS